MIKPNDLGQIVENNKSIKIDDLIKQVNKRLKYELLRSTLVLAGLQVSLTTSGTRFEGKRIWFLCPNCGKRKGTLDVINSVIGCRVCFNLKYKKQRYKGMLENIL